MSVKEKCATFCNRADVTLRGRESFGFVAAPAKAPAAQTLVSSISGTKSASNNLGSRTSHSQSASEHRS